MNKNKNPNITPQELNQTRGNYVTFLSDLEDRVTPTFKFDNVSNGVLDEDKPKSILPDWVRNINPKALPAYERDRFILAYVPLIECIAQETAERVKEVRYSKYDLTNEGVIGLMDTIDKYDPSRENTFRTYAEFRIKGAMLDYIRELDWAPRSVRIKEKEIDKAVQEVRKLLLMDPTTEQIANFMEIGMDKLVEWQKEIAGVNMLHLEDSFTRDSFTRNSRYNQNSIDKQAPLSNLIEDLRQHDIQYSKTFDSEIREILNQAVNSLPYKQRTVFDLYYNGGLTMEEIGKVLGVTQSRISQLYSNAVLGLRSVLKKAEI